MKRIYNLALVLLFVQAVPGLASDWPQFMRQATHTGDAGAEVLPEKLGLVAQVQLDDAIMTAPAVVAGKAYIVDQMGTAYAIDPDSGKILWRSAPDGNNARGSNTSSPCVVKGRVYYGTTARRLHILAADSGKVIRSVELDWPLTASPVFSNERIYFQTVGGVVHCFDLAGNEQWRWDHFARYQEDPKKWQKFPGSYDRPHFGGNEVAIKGKLLVTGMGWDHLCLEDAGKEAKLVWCNRAALGKDDGVPMACSISGDHVYTAWPGVDAAGCLLRVDLKTGKFERKADFIGRDLWGIVGTPAVRDETVYFGRHHRGLHAHRFGKGQLFTTYHWAYRDRFTPCVSSPALTKNHVLYTTLTGELIAVPLDTKGAELIKMKPAPIRFQTPNGKAIVSSPAVSKGRVYFGCDDGCLYVLGANGQKEPRKLALKLHERRQQVEPAAGKKSTFPSPYAGPGNTNFIDDPLKPPFRLRWAVRSFAFFKQPMIATEQDLVFTSMAGLIACYEQSTGRLRWRIRGTEGGYPGLLYHAGKLYVPGPTHRDAKLLCIDLETGNVIWSAEIGNRGSTARAAPVVSNGVVAFGHIVGAKEKRKPVIQAWDADTGKPLWQVDVSASGNYNAPTGAMHDGVFYFSCGAGAWQFKGEEGKRGQTLALDAKTGKVLWKTSAFHGSGSSAPAVRGNELFLIDNPELAGLDRKTGKVLWKIKVGMWFHSPCFGADFFTGRGYSGHAVKYDLKTHEKVRLNKRDVLLGAEAHACSPVVLTSGGISVALSVAGLHVRDVKTGELLWKSRGFAPRTCAHPAVANGRAFVNPQVNGMIYCFEPDNSGARGASAP